MHPRLAGRIVVEHQPRLEFELLERRITPSVSIIATKTVDLSTAHPGDTLTYSVGITNNSGADLTNVQFLDTVDAVVKNR